MQSKRRALSGLAAFFFDGSVAVSGLMAPPAQVASPGGIADQGLNPIRPRAIFAFSFRGAFSMKYLPWIAVCVLALSGCTDREAERQAQAAAMAQANEQKAAELEKRYDQAVQSSNWDMAR